LWNQSTELLDAAAADGVATVAMRARVFAFTGTCPYSFSWRSSANMTDLAAFLLLTIIVAVALIRRLKKLQMRLCPTSRVLGESDTLLPPIRWMGASDSW